MRERYFRAILFAFFATVGLMVGGFVVGYGAALLSAPSPPPVALPTLAPTPQGSPTPAEAVPAAVTPTAQPTPTPGPTNPPARAIPSPAPTLYGESEGGGLYLSLESLDVNAAQGGVEVVIHLYNGTGRDVNFSFSPGYDMWLVDSLGRRYELRWAEYDGVVRAPAGGDLRLVRAFFGGLPGEGAEYLTVRVKHLPQLPEHDWQVPLGR